MRVRNKLFISVVFVIIYLILAYVVYEYFAFTVINEIVNFPFAIFMALTYGMGGLIGLLFYLSFLICLGGLVYFILSFIKNKGTLS
jgi:hypothetical protein